VILQYNARKAALDSMVDDQLMKQEAETQGLSITDYLKRELDEKAVAVVDDAFVRKFYDQNKDKIRSLKKEPYATIRPPLLSYLQRTESQKLRRRPGDRSDNESGPGLTQVRVFARRCRNRWIAEPSRSRFAEFTKPSFYKGFIAPS